MNNAKIACAEAAIAECTRLGKRWRAARKAGAPAEKLDEILVEWKAARAESAKVEAALVAVGLADVAL